MIRLTDINGEQHPLTDYTNYHVKHMLNGCDIMSFCFDTGHEQYPLIQEECKIQTDGNAWLVKKIDDDKIDCELDFDFLKAAVYVDYSNETRSLAEVLQSHLPSGWTVEGASVSTIRRTIEFDYCTDYDVIMECMDTYGVYFVWHILEKRLVVFKPELMQPTGEYVTSELNLRSLSFKGSSSDFATRLYAYGKDGMTMEEAIVDGSRYGLTYVENNDYSDKLVCAYWSDDRYTVPENLYADALEKLNTMSWPVRAYECNVVDLAKQNPDYSFLAFSMHKKITLIDTERSIRVEHQIVEYDEYPDEPELNVVTLSCATETITSRLHDNLDTAVADLENKIGTGDNIVTEALVQRLNAATAMLTGAFGNYTYSMNGELFMMDNPDPAVAQVVWRWNVNGFGKSSTGIDGPYTTALTFDDQFITSVINAMVIRGSLIEADSIEAKSISQSYTDGVLQQSFMAAEGKIEAKFGEISEYLTNDEKTGALDVIQESIHTLRETVDGINVDFKEVFRGGINYIANSSGQNGVSADWITSGTVEAVQSSDTKNTTVANSCFRLAANATLSQTIDSIVPGTTYAISLKAKKTSSNLSTVKVVYNGNQEAYVFSSSVASGWAEYSYVLPDIQSSNIQIVVSTSSSDLFVADIMLCEGATPKAWTPAPNEIYTSGVNIDKNGIEVYRSENSEKTVITNSKFAGYYNDEEIFSLNKDETRTKKTVVDGDLTVGSCKFITFNSGSSGGLNIVVLD